MAHAGSVGNALRLSKVDRGGATWRRSAETGRGDGKVGRPTPVQTRFIGLPSASRVLKAETMALRVTIILLAVLVLALTVGIGLIDAFLQLS